MDRSAVECPCALTTAFYSQAQWVLCAGNLSPHCTAHTFRNTDVYTQADSLVWDLHREQPIRNKPDRYNQTHQTHSVHSQHLCLTVYGADSVCTGVPELQTEDFTIV